MEFRFSTLRSNRLAVFTLTTMLLAAGSLHAQPLVKPITTDQWQRVVTKNVNFLRARGQAQDGSFSSAAGVGPTGLVLAGLLSAGVPAGDPMCKRALNFLQGHIQPDGGIYKIGSLHRNYDTCIAMVAFAKTKKQEYEKIVIRAENFVKRSQYDATENRDESAMDFGGAGYGSHERPDLSNTSYLVDALHELGRGSEDAAIQKALIFISRCQNLESPHNTSPHAAKINDGGFYYTVANGGETKAGTTPNGGLRSYGSMTYAGLKSMVYAGLTKDDPRVAAAVSFLKKHYSVDENPGVGQQGLFYYFHTMAKALHTLGDQRFVDESGNQHDWRAEIFTRLSSLQNEDGSWTNPTSRWMEGDPNLVSGYALLTLAICKPEEQQ